MLRPACRRPINELAKSVGLNLPAFLGTEGKPEGGPAKTPPTA